MPDRITVKNARLSFPHLYEHEVYNGESTGKYACTFLVPKADKHTITRIEKEVAKVKGKNKIPDDKVCWRDGDETEYESHKGHMYFKASTNRRPVTVDQKRTPLTAEDERFYPGCYVNGIVDFWLQLNPKYPKRVNATLWGVQFAGEGEHFGAAPAKPEDFDEVTTEPFSDGEGDL